jgi:hypothetical protein
MGLLPMSERAILLQEVRSSVWLVVVCSLVAGGVFLGGFFFFFFCSMRCLSQTLDAVCRYPAMPFKPPPMPTCARCNKTVYQVDELKCLDKVRCVCVCVFFPLVRLRSSPRCKEDCIVELPCHVLVMIFGCLCV